MINILKTEEKEAFKDGFGGLRVVTDMSWIVKKPAGIEKIFEYEDKMNKLVSS